jgi:uncharacterized LabA/DUF88 family protein
MLFRILFLSYEKCAILFYELPPGQRTRKSTLAGVITGGILLTPFNPRSISFIDGQNLFRSAKEAFGYPFPNYDVLKLSNIISAQNHWSLVETRFYTGVPDPSDPRHVFWKNKLASMGRRGIVMFTRPIRTRMKEITCSRGHTERIPISVEKGVDVRIAIDFIRLAFANRFDVAIIFSQDQDLSEAAKEIRSISFASKRWIKIASAFPVSDISHNKRGIDHTDWIKIDRDLYDRCIDPVDYRYSAASTPQDSEFTE